MGCIINLNKNNLTFDHDQDFYENEEPLNHINNPIQTNQKSYKITQTQIECLPSIQINKPSSYHQTSNYSRDSNSNSIKSCLKKSTPRSISETNNKNVHFNSIIKIVFRNKVYYLRRIRRSKNKKNKINLDEIF